MSIFVSDGYVNSLASISVVAGKISLSLKSLSSFGSILLRSMSSSIAVFESPIAYNRTFAKASSATIAAVVRSVAIVVK